MRIRLFPMFVVCLVCTFAVQAQTVDESRSRVVLSDTNAEASIFVDNSSGEFDGNIKLEILDAENKVRAAASQNVRAKTGKQLYKISMPVGDLMKKNGDDIAWYRLHYRVGRAEGIVSLSELLKGIFDLRVAASQNVFPGSDYRVRVRAINSFTKQNIRKVAVEGTLTLVLDTEADNDEIAIKATGTTDSDGFAVLNFKIPETLKLDDESKLKVVGTKNGIVREIEEDLDSDEQNGSVFLTTDKPIYQPGQDFNVRGLYFDFNHTVVPGSELEFSIKDQDDTVLYRENVKTSEYGIASISWKIPENAKLGDYRVEIEADDDLQTNELTFKVSRYDLPNFAVSALPDKSFYLTSDKQADIAISADYLFGKPVMSGKVRVVQEGERKWNWREQKYETDEQWSIEGAADANGKYTAKFDLGDEFAKLRSDNWRRFGDLHFAAYFTDLTTNRTEQRRFDIRLTKEPIHVYLIIRADNNPDLPVIGYVATFYADGTPAVCNVEIKGRKEMSEQFKTNDLGVGKFTFDVPKTGSVEQRYELRITARDKRGQTGTMDENLYLSSEDLIQIETDQIIYKAGDPVTVRLNSTQKEGLVYVDVVKDRAIIGTHSINLKNGHGELTIPFQPNFKGELTIGAYTDTQTSYWDDHMRASRGIIFPEQQNLLLNARFSGNNYRPGEEASVKFSVLDGAGRSAESALGIVVFDKAIEERAKTDAAFGSYFSRYFGLMGYEKSFGNISLKDLNDIDTSKPITPELQLAAEVMLAGNYYYPQIFHSSDNETDAKDVYSEFFKKQLAPVNAALSDQYAKERYFADDMAELDRMIGNYGIKFSDLRDPWGQQYQLIISTERTLGLVTLRSNGADKKAGTPDDFDVTTNRFQYFASTGALIDKAANEYRVRTGNYIRDLPTLTAELALSGFDLGKMKDRWGRDYRISFDVVGRDYAIKITSAGADGAFEAASLRKDDFDVWTAYVDYFLENEGDINLILNRNVNLGKQPFPKTNEEFEQMLSKNGLDIKRVKDGYGEPVYLTSSIETSYADKTTIENGKTKITPVTSEIQVFKIRSNGADKVSGADDFDLARFSSLITEYAAGPISSKAEIKSLAFSGAKGAIRGTVIDPNGAVVPGVEIIATDETDAAKIYRTVSGDDGEFLLQNLPSGRYRVEAAASMGFQRFRYENITVRSMNLVELNITLYPAATSATVDVTAAPAEMDQTSNSTATTVTRAKGLGRITFISTVETSTPRLREYFPETLLWKPELITDKKGKAELKFKLADNITTWKMYTIASTKKGKIGVAEKEITAFQPFFVDLDPPKFLTEGDEISLPVQVRNYTDEKQKVDVSMAKGDWFSFLIADKQQVDVDAGASQNTVFGFKAVTAIKDGKQRVTAIAKKDSDAIEKPVTVRPNGQEIVQTESKFFAGSGKFDINFPANALPGTQKAELKIYPNLFSHVSESVEGLLQRPYGCGEQTISSTYPNVMILKFVKADTPLRRKARKYLQKGYERLIGYQAADGGFTYWGGKDAGDIALTAYGLRFLADAGEFVEVDSDVVQKAQDWLIKQQNADGSWIKKYSWGGAEDANHSKLTTTYIARSLAMLRSAPRDTKISDAALQKALAYLRSRNAEIDEPYALALFGLASLDSGDVETAKAIAQRLEKLAISEGDSVYWKLETNTPFYGWGTAGRIETTALVLQLLIRDAGTPGNVDAARKDLISKATLFLLKNKDRYGVWYSTQTTINVLDAFLAALANKAETPPLGSVQDSSIQIMINGENIQNIPVDADRIEPIVLDLTNNLAPAANTIEIQSPNPSPLMSQMVAEHYIDWKDANVSGSDANRSRALRLDYKCDRQETAIMQDVSCSVEAERVGFRGYGMLLAEIGIPPGADVSRESLQNAMESDRSLSRYDILPDRIVVYMWAKAGGTKFNFKFRPRYGINAQTPASEVYDYYNPEARAAAAPLKFIVK